MLPHFNSHPYHSNQIQADGTSASATQQGMPSNHFQGNPSNILPNSVQIQSQMGIINPHNAIPIQSQMGIINPHNAIPFNNSHTHLSNGTVAMPNSLVSTPSPCFMNAPNHLPLQNGVPLLGVMSHPGQCHGVFSHQNLNPISTFPVQSMNGMNPSQPSGQLFAHNSTNLPQYFNQNAGLPNGQFCLQNPMQNLNQFVQMHLPNYAQGVPCGLPPYPNQIPQVMGLQNPNIFANPQFGLIQPNGAMQPGNQYQHKFVSSTTDANALKKTPHSITQQLQGNSSSPLAFGSVQPQQTKNNFLPPVFIKSQGNPGKDSGNNNLKTNWRNSQNRNFTRNPKRDASHRGFPNSQFHHMQNAKGKFGFHHEHGGKGYNNDGARKSGVGKSSNQTRVEQRRPLCLNYTAQEIQQWREERRKNYPSKANMEKKLTESEVTDRDAKLRRQQLQEILAKQAELGCEVAEIPSYYLSDSEKLVNRREGNKREFTKKERFHDKFNKRGRFHQNDRFSKKQRLADHDSCNVHDQNDQFSKKQRSADNDSSTRPTLCKREPTLFQKLLSADIRREKSHLLQVFRFIVMNSFFKDWSKNPLRFASVKLKVKETGCDDEVVEEKSSNVGREVS
uniref:FMR1-interacting protein 1 conserved domain-containing protein n=1 Tax=Davidia involucrata TaxID=16924 RepID=A0A5B7AD80_DAVIN